MRKAGVAAIRRKTGRKQDEPTATTTTTTTTNTTAPLPSEKPEKHEKAKKQSAEEAALTAKNYRLAKELSELRVRHREECKNVTRLTMENMNLASRCREAIGKAASLKKELASHQRRAAEAMALQRQQHHQQQQQQQVKAETSDTSVVSQSPRSSPEKTSPKFLTLSPENADVSSDTNNSNAVESSPLPKSSLTDVAVEMEKMDRILAAHARKAKAGGEQQQQQQQGPLVTQHVLSFTKQQQTPPKQMHLVCSDDFEGDDSKNSSGNEDAPFVGEVETTSPTTSLDTASDLVVADVDKESKEDDWEEVDKLKIATTVIRNLNAASPKRGGGGASGEVFFPHSASPKLDRGMMMGERSLNNSSSSSYNEEYPADITAAGVVRTQQHLHQARTKVDRIGEFAENEEEEDDDDDDDDEESLTLLLPTAADDNAPTISSRLATPFDSLLAKEDKSTLSSIDAFEASFHTSFPDSFSPKEEFLEEQSKNKKASSLSSTTTTTTTSPTGGAVSIPGTATSEPYNPFSSSPAKAAYSPRLVDDDWKEESAVVSSSTEQTTMSNSAATATATAITMSSTLTPWSSTSSIIKTASPVARGAAAMTTMFSANHSTSSDSYSSISPRSTDPPGRDRTSPRNFYLDSTKKTFIPHNNSSGGISPNSKAPTQDSQIRSYSPPNNGTAALSFSSNPDSAAATAAATTSALAGVRSPVPSDSSNTKLPLASSSSSCSSDPSPPKTSSPSFSQPSTPPVKRERQRNSDGFSTPPTTGNKHPSPVSSTGSVGALSEREPKRPEKTGYDAARARYEKALQPRAASSASSSQNSGSSSSSSGSQRSSSYSSKQSPPSDEKSSLQPTYANHRKKQQQPPPPPPPSTVANARERLSPSSSTSSPYSSTLRVVGPRDKTITLWNKSDVLSDEEDGDIPLRSSLTKPVRTESLISNTGTTTTIASSFEVNRPNAGVVSNDSPPSRSRPRPWEKNLNGITTTTTTTTSMNSSPSSVSKSITSWSTNNNSNQTSPRKTSFSDDDEMDPSNSPLSRFRSRSTLLTTMVVPNNKSLVPCATTTASAVDPGKSIPGRNGTTIAAAGKE